MSQAVTATLKAGDEPCVLRFDACRLVLGGEFAGNIELDVACEPRQINRIFECLRVQVPGSPPTETALGNGPYGSGVQLIFWTPPSNQPTERPTEITLLWGETPIAAIRPTLKDSVAIEQQVTFIEPCEILKTLPVVTSNHVLLAANRQKAWFLLAALEIIGGALVAMAFPGLALPSLLLGWAVGGTMIASGVGIGFWLAWVPYLQFWLDRDRRRVLIVDGRTRNPQAKFAQAPGRSLDDFHHVRIYQRWRMAQGVDDHDQEVWHVALEPRIPFASEDGTVHLHDEALPIGEFASDLEARRVAAVVGFHTGLKILDTGHDQTA